MHWITGKDLPNNACDTIPARQFVGPACVIDVTRDVERNPDFLLTADRTRGVGARARPHSARRLGAAAHRLEQANGRRRVSQRRRRRPAQPGFRSRRRRALLAHDRDVLGVGVETIGTDAGQAGTFDPPFPNHTIMHGAGKFGLASLCNLDQLPPTGAIVIAAPLKIVDGSGSPLRVLAITPYAPYADLKVRASRQGRASGEVRRPGLLGRPAARNACVSLLH